MTIIKKQASKTTHFKALQETLDSELINNIDKGEKVARKGGKEGVREGFTPLSISTPERQYFDIIRLQRTFISMKIGLVTPKMLMVFCAIASYGSVGCSTRSLLIDLFGYDCSIALRGLNNCIGVLVKRGLVVRMYRRLFISVSAEKILSGRKL